MNNTEPSDVSEVKNNAESKLLLDPSTTKSSTSSVLQHGSSSSSRPVSVRCVDDVFRELPITDDTSCGIWCLRGPNLQRFANKKAYVFLYGVLGCIFSASYAYFNGTITTLEKRFKIPSKTTGIITVGNDISQLLIAVVLAYYAGRGHRPRWIAVGIYTVVLFCVLTMLPHFIYGPGDDALQLTKEFGSGLGSPNATLLLGHDREHKFLCLAKEHRDNECADEEEEEGNFAPQVILFLGQLFGGIGGSLYYTLGVSYMDDNIQKSKTPALISFSYFLRMLGPAMGYTLASFTLNFYISPSLTPTITKNDPRWLGAWWMGWIILAILLSIFAIIIALFPKTLPRAAARKVLALERSSKSTGGMEKNTADEPVRPASLKDMAQTFKRLLSNNTLMCNNLATVFYFLGYMPYWIFMPKYIETQYRQSASFSSLITGTVGLVFTAFGILLSGLIISKFKPRARYLAGWNVIVALISVMGMISYAFLKCTANDNQIIMSGVPGAQSACIEDCNCDYVTYNPVCSDDGRTFISACHAGCKTLTINPDGTKIYSNCSCITSTLNQTNFSNLTNTINGTASSGPCPVDCKQVFYLFLAVVCIMKFVGATGRASNFLVSVRCVEEKDKTVAMGMGLTIMSLFAFIPSPILFGFILDKTCLVWGKTCTGTGNCWLYDDDALRYLLNFTATGFVIIGTLFDIAVWYFVKDVKIFDEEVELDTLKEEQPSEPKSVQ